MARTVAVVGCLAMLAAVASAGHNCAHDSPTLREMIDRDLANGPIMPSEADRRRAQGARSAFHAEAFANIRFAIGTDDLNNPSKYCATVGQSVSNLQGATVTCTAEDILTTTKKEILLNQILPAAFAKLSQALLVEPVTANIVVPASACSGFTTPAAHRTTGVAGADYVLYVAAAPTSRSTLAWAGGCRADSAGRYVVGRANFGPAHIAWDTAAVQKEVVATAVHELLHALGFSSSSFGGRTRAESLRGKTASLLVSPLAFAKFNAHLGCAASTLPGIELEDEGGAGSAGSHWERRVLMEDVMTAAGGEKLSAVTLAAMQDLGHYRADFSQAEPMTWGRNAGCSFVTAKCDTTEGGRGTWWCFDASGPGATDACTHDSRAIGHCATSTYTADLPAYFQYFSDPRVGGPDYVDACPFVQAYSNRQCDDAGATLTDADRRFGNYYGGGGRCFRTTGLIQTAYTSSGGSDLRCLESRCSGGYAQLRVNGGTWETCTSANQQMSGFSGFKGSVICPADLATFCASFDASATLSPDGATSEPSPTPPTATLPTMPSPALTNATFSVDASLRFSGLGWSELVSSSRSAVSNAASLSIAILLALPTTSVDVRQLTIGSLVVAARVTSSYQADEIAARLQVAQECAACRQWFNPLATVYARGASGNNDTVALVAHETTTVNGMCAAVDLDSGTCVVVFSCTAAAVVVMALFILWCCCCRRTPEQENAHFHRKLNERRNDPFNCSVTMGASASGSPQGRASRV